MIRVTIDINGHIVEQTYAVRTANDPDLGGVHEDSVNIYTTEDGKIISHRYGDGAAKLAIKMLGIITDG